MTRVYRRTFEPAATPQPRSSNQQRLREDLLAGAKEFGCYYCGRRHPATAATLEHIIPLAYGGTDHRDNLALACDACNRSRNALVMKLARGENTEGFPLCLWKGIVLQRGVPHFEIPGAKARKDYVPQPAFKRTDHNTRPLPPNGGVTPRQRLQAEIAEAQAEVKKADVAWFKARLSEVAILALRDPVEAACLAAAVAGVPRHLSPTRDAEQVAEFVELNRAEKREWLRSQPCAGRGAA